MNTTISVLGNIPPTFLPRIIPGDSQGSYCVRECWDLLESEIIKTLGMDLRITIFFLFLIAGGLFIMFYLKNILEGFYLKNILEGIPDLKENIIWRFIKLYITLAWFISAVILVLYFKFAIGFTGII